MQWKKKGLIFNPKKNTSNWINSYAALPVCHLVSKEKVRIYFATRDEHGRSIPTFIDVSAQEPNKILNIHKEPILPLGPQGSFDDNGIMPSSIVETNGRLFMYYIGWNPQITVSYRLSIGLAVSEDGINFKKYSVGPLLDRDKEEPYFNTAPYVIKEGNLWRMWYVSCTGWKNIKNWPEPFYLIRYAESKNGIDWERKNIECIGYDDFTHAIGKPMVYKQDNCYHMIYSYRNSLDYRVDPNQSYRLGFATSKDGIYWERKDEEIDFKKDVQDWESIMQEYSSTFVVNNQRFLVYNGNGFGETGFGYAILTED